MRSSCCNVDSGLASPEAEDARRVRGDGTTVPNVGAGLAGREEDPMPAPLTEANRPAASEVHDAGVVGRDDDDNDNDDCEAEDEDGACTCSTRESSCTARLSAATSCSKSSRVRPAPRRAACTAWTSSLRGAASVSVVVWENFLEGEGERRGTLQWGGKAVGGRGVDLHVSRDHLGGGVVVVLVQFELGQCIGQPYALFLRSPPFRLRLCTSLFELTLQPTNLVPQRLAFALKLPSEFVQHCVLFLQGRRSSSRYPRSGGPRATENGGTMVPLARDNHHDHDLILDSKNVHLFFVLTTAKHRDYLHLLTTRGKKTFPTSGPGPNRL
jgi:hypothetical protein